MLGTTILVATIATLAVIVGVGLVVGLRLRGILREVQGIVESVRPEVDRLQEGVELAAAEWERISSTPIRD